MPGKGGRCANRGCQEIGMDTQIGGRANRGCQEIGDRHTNRGCQEIGTQIGGARKEGVPVNREACK